ncbi:MAG: hypothetical protein Q9183_004423 [Haloplaca sp. 2 TL-2023]
MPPTPIVPVEDDMDDLYGDSPATRPDALASAPITETSKQSTTLVSNADPQSSTFQLPGLGLWTPQLSEPTPVVNDGNEAQETNQVYHVDINGEAHTKEPTQLTDHGFLSSPLNGAQPMAEDAIVQVSGSEFQGNEQNNGQPVRTEASNGSGHTGESSRITDSGLVSQDNEKTPGPSLTKELQKTVAIDPQGEQSDGQNIATAEQMKQPEVTKNETEPLANGKSEAADGDQPALVEGGEPMAVDAMHMEQETAGINGHENEAEFEMDSSPIESSSSDDTDSDSSSSSGGSDYEMLDPAEEARRLMQEDGGSDDEGKASKTTSGPLRTLNEKPDEVVPKPQIEVTPAMTISDLGNVEHVVENSILIRAKTSGESRALEGGSLLCLGDRSVIGVVAEILGQVQQPYYSVRFTNAAAIAEAGISKGTPVFYVEQYSSYVFTQSLKALKGSDASNIHDEEVGDDELEFSDDEKEAEYKRRVKQEKLAKKAGRGGRGGRDDGFSMGPRGSRRGGRGSFNNHESRSVDSSALDYDDGDDLYTPLARPSNLHEIMGRGEAPQENLNNGINGTNGNIGSHSSNRGRPDRGRGRGDRGRGGRGGRGDRRGGGGFNRDSRNRPNDGHQSQYHPHPLPSPVQASHYPDFPPHGNDYQPPPQSWSSQYSGNQSAPSYPQPFQAPQQQPYSNYNTYSQAPSHPQYSPNQYPMPQQQPPQAFNHQYAPYQAQSPPNPVPANFPPGAHINPAFFANNSVQQQQQEGYGNSQQTGGGRSPQSEEAFRAAQDRLEFLRQMSRSGGGPP